MRKHPCWRACHAGPCRPVQIRSRPRMAGEPGIRRGPGPCRALLRRVRRVLSRTRGRRAATGLCRHSPKNPRAGEAQPDFMLRGRRRTGSRASSTCSASSRPASPRRPPSPRRSRGWPEPPDAPDRAVTPAAPSPALRGIGFAVLAGPVSCACSGRPRRARRRAIRRCRSSGRVSPCTWRRSPC